MNKQQRSKVGGLTANVRRWARVCGLAEVIEMDAGESMLRV